MLFTLYNLSKQLYQYSYDKFEQKINDVVFQPNFLRHIIIQEIAEKEKTRAKRIFLVRHGETTANVDPMDYSKIPDNQIQLTDKGIQQAKLCGKKLKQIIGKGKVRFFVSPFRRTKMTYQNIIESFKIIKDDNEQKEQEDNNINDKEQELFYASEDPRIREQEFGNFEKFLLNQEDKKRTDQERDTLGKFLYRYKDGESSADAYDRCSLFIQSLLKDMEYEEKKYDDYVIVTHGLLMRCFLARYFKWSIKKFESIWNPSNCEIWILEKKGKDGLYQQTEAWMQEEQQQQYQLLPKIRGSEIQNDEDDLLCEQQE